MTYRPRFRAALILLCLTLAGGAHADDAPARQNRKPRTAHVTAKVVTAPRQSLDQIRSDLYHGSASQQEMERNDNDRIGRKPVDHGKDEFFSDWKGLR